MKNSRNQVLLLHRDYNLDKKDNIQELPELPAVYAMCATLNGGPVNCRYIGETSNLRKSVLEHYTSSDAATACLVTFLKSIKIKTLVFEVCEQMTDAQRRDLKTKWEHEFKPECNEKLNEVF